MKENKEYRNIFVGLSMVSTMRILKIFLLIFSFFNVAVGVVKNHLYPAYQAGRRDLNDKHGLSHSERAQ